MINQGTIQDIEKMACEVNMALERLQYEANDTWCEDCSHVATVRQIRALQLIEALCGEVRPRLFELITDLH